MENVRIDKGVKRGARIMPAPPQRRKAPVARDNGKLSKADPHEVIARYFRDESTAQIAQSLGVHRSALHQWLIRNCEQDWRDAQVARAITALEQAKDDLAVAADPLSLARAREVLRGAQWELERLFSRLYAPKQQVTLDVNIDLGDRLMRAEHRVIEGEHTQITQDTGNTLINKE